MTTLPVPIADFRANLKKYADMLRAGGLEILVTNHGKAILRCLTPDDVLPEVENPPGVNVELMERLLSGEGEDRLPDTITPGYTDNPGAAAVGDPVYFDGPFGKQLVGHVAAKTPTASPRFVFPSDLNDGFFRPSPTDVHRVVDGVDVGPVADDAGKVTVVDDNDPFGLLDFLGEEG